MSSACRVLAAPFGCKHALYQHTCLTLHEKPSLQDPRKTYCVPSILPPLCCLLLEELTVPAPLVPPGKRLVALLGTNTQNGLGVLQMCRGCSSSMLCRKCSSIMPLRCRIWLFLFWPRNACPCNRQGTCAKALARCSAPTYDPRSAVSVRIDSSLVAAGKVLRLLAALRR